MGQRSSAEHRDLSALAPELSQSLLAWWEVHGRKDPALKPWMFTKDGRWPEPHEHLNVLECWIAMLIKTVQSLDQGTIEYYVLNPWGRRAPSRLLPSS